MKRDKCIFNVDKTFIIKTWNSNMERLCHKPAQSVIGSKVKEVFPLLHDKIALVLNDGRKRQIKNFRNTCFMGTNLSADVEINPVKDKKGKVIEVSIILDNISGECPLDKKLTDSERMIAIGKIASTLAHGVRNPLNAIKGAVVYLREKYGHEQTLLEFSKIINDEISRLDNFISNFLSAAKGQTKFIPVNLNDILKAILIMIKPRTEVQNIKVLHNFSVLPLITADPFQIEQALFNIINNAIEAMPKGGLIEIKTSLTHENNIDYGVVEISDTGKGIPKKELCRLGELSGNPKREDKGFGIFLSREIIKSHNGKLFWESIKDRGTTFKIYLPVKHDR
jgi:two-component system nitrogen regulation sensor histidine kinase GlnL